MMEDRFKTASDKIHRTCEISALMWWASFRSSSECPCQTDLPAPFQNHNDRYYCRQPLLFSCGGSHQEDLNPSFFLQGTITPSAGDTEDLHSEENQDALYGRNLRANDHTPGHPVFHYLGYHSINPNMRSTLMTQV